MRVSLPLEEPDLEYLAVLIDQVPNFLACPCVQQRKKSKKRRARAAILQEMSRLMRSEDERIEGAPGTQRFFFTQMAFRLKERQMHLKCEWTSRACGWRARSRWSTCRRRRGFLARYTTRPAFLPLRLHLRLRHWLCRTRTGPEI